MGFKTVANDLDNARVWFDKVRMPKSALLNKFCDIKDNEYVQEQSEWRQVETRDASSSSLARRSFTQNARKAVQNALPAAQTALRAAHSGRPRSQQRVLALLARKCVFWSDPLALFFSNLAHARFARRYVQVGEERMRIEVIGQRLMTGRQAIAEASLVSCMMLHKKTEEYAKNKVCNAINGEVSLASMPQLKHVFDESYRKLNECIGFVAAVENELNECLRTGTIPSDELVDKIAVCKIRAISVSIERAHALRLEVGSYALMHDTGFELMDMLLCCKFAEGDSRILQMKLMRDRLKKIKKAGVGASVFAALSDTESRKALLLANKLNVGRDLDKMQDAMVENWAEIYELAELIEERIMRDTPPAVHIEGESVQRLEAADVEYDTRWLDKIGTQGVGGATA